MAAEGLVAFDVQVKQTDLRILAESDLSEQALRSVRIVRRTLEKWIARDRDFIAALSPLSCPVDAPKVIREMCAAGQAAGVGPMAAVAGAIAERVARDLSAFSPNVIVENGGDTFLMGDRERLVSIFAGRSPLSQRLALVVPPERQPLSVCTSSGTVGPSMSFGQADAAVIVARNAALADGVATAVGNRVRKPADVGPAVEWASSIPGLIHVVAILGEHMAAWGALELRTLHP
jgi:ApbE superfamily uncharacterized protein (UPF0280 family)